MHELREALRAAGARPRHETLMLRAWVRGLPLDAFAQSEDSQLPLALRARAAGARERVRARSSACAPSIAAPTPRRASCSRSSDGRTVESVLLPGDGVCVSTQVGCAVGCVFCMTGRDGLARHLTSGEIVAQVALARTRQRGAARRVHGHGRAGAQPRQRARRDRAARRATAISRTKNLVFSTVGDRRVFERLPLRSVKPALALSLHTTKPELRAQLLPRAPRIEPAELVALADAYARATKYPTQYQWTLLEGVNDGDDELDALATLLAGPLRRRELHSVQHRRRRGASAGRRGSAPPR